MERETALRNRYINEAKVRPSDVFIIIHEQRTEEERSDEKEKIDDWSY